MNRKETFHGGWIASLRKTIRRTLACVVLACLSMSVSAVPAILTDYTLQKGYAAPEILSDCAFLMDAGTGTVLYAKNENDPHAPASTIKTLTALLALENCAPAETVTFSEESITDIEVGGHNYELQIGETMSLRSCIQIMITASANEAAYAIAEHVGGSIEGFAEMMNKKAEQLGATDSHFTNPHGLTDEEQYTTAHDLALIFSACVRNKAFLDTTAIEGCCVTDTTVRTEGYAYTNHDKMMLSGNEFHRDYVVCGKTGFTTQAGNTLVTYAVKDGLQLVCVILNGEGYENVYSDTIGLCEWAFEHYTYLPMDALAGKAIDSELGPSEVKYGVPGVVVPDNLLLKVKCAVSGFKKESGSDFSAVVSTQIGDLNSVITSAEISPIGIVYFASDFEAEETPPPEVVEEPTLPVEIPMETPEQGFRFTWITAVQCGAVLLLALSVTGNIVLRHKLRRARAARKIRQAEERS